MTKAKKAKTIKPTDFHNVHRRFKEWVEALYNEDNIAAKEAYQNLTLQIYKYGNAVMKYEAVGKLAVYLAQRDRSTSVFSMEVYRLALELIMPGKFPPLGASLRSKLALTLAFANKRGIRSAELTAFLGKLPPVKSMKEELGLTVRPEGPDDGGKPPRAPHRKPRPRKKQRSRVPHRLAGSASDKLRKAGARAFKRLPRTDLEK